MQSTEVNWQDARLNLAEGWVTVDKLPKDADKGLIREHFADITRPDKVHELSSYLRHIEEHYADEELTELLGAMFTLLVAAYLHQAPDTDSVRKTLEMFMEKDDKGEYIVNDDVVHVMARILGYTKEQIT